MRLSKKQIAGLQFARTQGLADGTCEQICALGISGAALSSVVAALRKRGLIDGDYGLITENGQKILDEIKGALK